MSTVAQLPIPKVQGTNIETSSTGEDQLTTITAYRELLRQNPSNDGVHRKLAEIYRDTDQFSRACRHARQAYDIAPHSCENLVAYVSILLWCNQASEAVSLGLNHLNQFGESPELITILMQLRQMLDDMMARGLTSTQEQLDLIRLYIASKHFPEAARIVESAIQQTPNSSLLLVARRELVDAWRPYMQARRYINPAYSLEEFFTLINDRGIRYVVLRWFDRLPAIAQYEDIDFLVHDDDLEVFGEYLVPYPYNNAQKCDVYSVTGQPGSDYLSCPYYQANLALKILENRVMWDNLAYVPCPEDHFFSLLYHVTYHKAERSGLSVDEFGAPPLYQGEHDYAAILTNLAKPLGMRLITPTLVTLHELLRDNGWMPSIDLIRKLGNNRSPWLYSLFPAMGMEYGKSGSLSVFILREWGINRNLMDVIVKGLEAEGYEILFSAVLDAAQRKNASLHLRGGNWGRGPWPISGGRPAAAFVAYDQVAAEPHANLRRQHPFLNNQRTADVKAKLRDIVNNRLPPEQRTNCLHSCDDELECWEYITILFPEHRTLIEARLQTVQKAYTTAEPVLTDLSGFQRRAKVELVLWGEEHRVKKTYKRDRQRYLDRELTAYRKLSRSNPFIPELIDSGENWLLLPFYKPITGDARRVLLRTNLKRVAEFIRRLFRQNYAHLDFHPDNLIFTSDGLMKVIDFEFLHQYETPPEDVFASYDLAGVPDGFTGDLPLGPDPIGMRQKIWKTQTGYTLTEILQTF